MLTLLPMRRRTPQEGLKVVTLPTPNVFLQARLAFVRPLHAISFSHLWNGIARLYLPTLVVRNDSLCPSILPPAATRIPPTG